MKKIIISFWVMLSIVLISGCGGGGDEDRKSENTTASSKAGIFKDNEVVGLYYTTNSTSGLTDESGKFIYKSGEKVRFYIGDIFLGDATGSDIITPLDLVDGAIDVYDPTVTNITRFLITIDDDNDLVNGIQITENVRSLCENVSLDFYRSVLDFENDGSVQTLVATLTSATSAGARSLVSTAFSQQHLQNTIDSILSDDSSGVVQLSGGDTSLIGSQFSAFMTVARLEESGIDGLVRAVDIGPTLEVEDDEFILDVFMFTNPTLQSIYQFQQSVVLRSVKNGVTREYACTDDSCGVGSVIFDPANRKVTLINVDVVNDQTGEALVLNGTLAWEE